MERTLGGVPHMPMDEKKKLRDHQPYYNDGISASRNEASQKQSAVWYARNSFGFFFFVRLCRIDDKRTFYEFLSLPKFGGETCGLITNLMKTDLTSSSSAVDGTQFGSHYLKSTRRYQRS
jgi:hypothetical protein